MADPNLPAYVSFMRSALSDLKLNLVRMLYEENRAYYYWSLLEEPFQTNDLTMATLSAVHATLCQDIKREMDARGVSQAFTQDAILTANPQSATEAMLSMPYAFRNLAATKQLAFTLAQSFPGFKVMYQVTVDTYNISLPDFTPHSGELRVDLTHSGKAYQTARPGAVASSVEFAHAPVRVPYHFDYQDNDNKGGGQIGDPTQGYIGLSPFTLWTLDFSSSDQTVLDLLKEVKNIRLTFTGRFLGA